METTLSINGSIEMALRDALMIYRTKDGRAAYVTHHRVENGHLGPATALTGNFIEELSEQLRKRLKMEVLPPNVLARTNDSIVWWTPAQSRRMFFVDDERMTNLSGKLFPHPPLVWMAQGGDLSIRALRQNERPNAGTSLYVAPYWNVNDSGNVCLGDSPTPDTATTSNLDAWVDGFFASQFSHPNATKLVQSGGLYHNFLAELEGSPDFPPGSLIYANETLAKFIGGGE